MKKLEVYCMYTFIWETEEENKTLESDVEKGTKKVVDGIDEAVKDKSLLATELLAGEISKAGVNKIFATFAAVRRFANITSAIEVIALAGVVVAVIYAVYKKRRETLGESLIHTSWLFTEAEGDGEKKGKFESIKAFVKKNFQKLKEAFTKNEEIVKKQLAKTGKYRVARDVAMVLIPVLVGLFIAKHYLAPESSLSEFLKDILKKLAQSVKSPEKIFLVLVVAAAIYFFTKGATDLVKRAREAIAKKGEAKPKTESTIFDYM
ncbi:MAG: hypothetical protein QXP36_09335 [Conexivisphaerales archaeon]